MMGKLAAELITFEDDFLELSSPDFEKAEHTPLMRSMDVTAGSRMFRWLGELRSTGIRLRAQTLRTQRIFWLGNHTTGANWDTVEQLLLCAAEDEGANLCNPGFTPLTVELTVVTDRGLIRRAFPLPMGARMGTHSRFR